MHVVLTPNEEKPCVAWETARGFVLPNRRDSDYLGQVETLMLFNKLVVNVISNDAGNHTDDKRGKQARHI